MTGNLTQGMKPRSWVLYFWAIHLERWDIYLGGKLYTASQETHLKQLTVQIMKGNRYSTHLEEPNRPTLLKNTEMSINKIIAMNLLREHTLLPHLHTSVLISFQVPLSRDLEDLGHKEGSASHSETLYNILETTAFFIY